VFRLERGVTGFRSGKEPKLPEVPVRTFRGGCYEAARAADGAVEHIVESAYPRSYHSAVIVASKERLAVLCNAMHPWIAFAGEGTGHLEPKAFVDPPAWSAAFADLGFAVMSRQVLESPLAAVDTAALAKAEWLQIDSWQPATVGETVFNSWD
jgi:hypothetical protein